MAYIRVMLKRKKKKKKERNQNLICFLLGVSEREV